MHCKHNLSSLMFMCMHGCLIIMYITTYTSPCMGFTCMCITLYSTCTLQKLVGHINLTWVIWVATASRHMRVNAKQTRNHLFLHYHSHYYVANNAWLVYKTIWWYLVSYTIVLTLICLEAGATQITHVRVNMTHQFLQCRLDIWVVGSHYKMWRKIQWDHINIDADATPRAGYVLYRALVWSSYHLCLILIMRKYTTLAGFIVSAVHLLCFQCNIL
jgi:hypothetical protein